MANKISFIVFIYVVVISSLFVAGCNDVPRVVKPQKGGVASVSLPPSAPQIEVKQPENAEAGTVTIYEREYVPITNNIPASRIVTDTNWYVMRERFMSEFGAHQKDEARSGYVNVQKASAIIKAQSPVMYAGLILIVCAIGMSYFQAKFPAVFSPGLKVIALTFVTGLVLAVLPGLTQNKTVLTMGMLCGVFMLVVFVLGRRFSDRNSGDK